MCDERSQGMEAAVSNKRARKSAKAKSGCSAVIVVIMASFSDLKLSRAFKFSTIDSGGSLIYIWKSFVAISCKDLPPPYFI